MKRFFAWSSATIALFLIYPPAAVAVLIMLFIYYTGKTPESRAMAFVYTGGISYPAAQRDSIPEPRTKDYHDYQIEEFLLKRKDAKIAELENTGLSLDEEITLGELEKRLNED
jgi:hypothetical protein